MRTTISPGQTVFARWRNGYYYPAIIDEVLADHVKVSYLDGDTGKVQREHIVELQEALDTMQLQANWKHGGIFFKGKLASFLPPMVMNYNDGDVEQIELVQLRGKPKQKAEPAPTATARPSADHDAKRQEEQLKTLLKNGLISKEEYKRRRNLLR